MSSPPAKKAKTAAKKVALITGITGQDGSYLCEFLLKKGYDVHGIIRRSSSFNTGRIDEMYKDRHTCGANLHLHYGDLTDATNLVHIVTKVRSIVLIRSQARPFYVMCVCGQVQPDEVYNLAAQSHVQVSFEMAE